MHVGGSTTNGNSKTNKCRSVAGEGSTAEGRNSAETSTTRTGTSRKSGHAISPVNGATANNTRLAQRSYAGGTDQLWEPV